MSDYQLKPGQGSIFKNDRKKDEKHPDYKGNAMTPNGEEIEIALWVKEGKNGKFFSVKIQPKYVKPQAGSKPVPAEIPYKPLPNENIGGGAKQQPISNRNEPSDDLPFKTERNYFHPSF